MKHVLRGIWQASPEFLKQGRHAHRAGPPCPPFIFQESALPLRRGSRGETRQGSTRCTLKPGRRVQGVQDCLDALLRPTLAFESGLVGNGNLRPGPTNPWRNGTPPTIYPCATSRREPRLWWFLTFRAFIAVGFGSALGFLFRPLDDAGRYCGHAVPYRFDDHRAHVGSTEPEETKERLQFQTQGHGTYRPGQRSTTVSCGRRGPGSAASS